MFCFFTEQHWIAFWLTDWKKQHAFTLIHFIFSPVVLVVSTLHLYVTTSPMGSKTPLGHQFCRLSRICLTLLSLMAQRVGGAEKPFILGRHNMQWKRNREAHGMCEGGCHLCEGTSKDSSADVSKQDGCQVSSLNYLGNKNWLMFMRHAPVPKTALCFFNTAGSCFLPWSVNFLCAFCLFFNQMDWIFVPFDHTECRMKEEHFYCELLVN